MKLDVVQIAYHVKDIRKSAQQMVDRFGAGPFFVSENIMLSSAEHRGEPADFIHSSAYGQWGNVMVELVRQEDDSTATPFRDMYKKHEEGMHHTAVFIDDIQDAINHFEDKGLKLATRCITATGGVEFCFIDATPMMGHMIEIYVPTPPLQGFYDMVREAAIDWQGEDPIR
jgi:hypothetical protein